MTAPQMSYDFDSVQEEAPHCSILPGTPSNRVLHSILNYVLAKCRGDAPLVCVNLHLQNF